VNAVAGFFLHEEQNLPVEFDDLRYRFSVIRKRFSICPSKKNGGCHNREYEKKSRTNKNLHASPPRQAITKVLYNTTRTGMNVAKCTRGRQEKDALLCLPEAIIILETEEPMLKTILFDFGGVIGEEGFRDGLKEIAQKNDLNPDEFFRTAEEIIYSSGYLTGFTPEAAYWDKLRERTGIRGSDQDLKGEILKKFVIRPEMVRCADDLRAKGYSVVMLSDQTNWLDEINEQTGLFSHFDRILNSFAIGRSKRDPRTFQYVCDILGGNPGEIVFVDDNSGHIMRASAAGMKTILFSTISDFQKKVAVLAGVHCGQ
jgi:putative hydrolase of the HAD superfamily